MKPYRRAIAMILAIGILFTVPVSADGSEEAASTPVTEYFSRDLTGPIDDGASVSVAAPADFSALKAKSYILMEKETGQTLAADHENDELAPASITKIMSLLLVMDALDTGKLSLTQTIVCSEHAASMGGSQIWLEPGEAMAVDDLLKAVAVGSANDATVALAEAVAGSEEAFVAEMNETAQALGMEHTHFVNCSGLDDDGQYTSARDIALMARALLQHDAIKNYTTIWMDSLRNGATQLVNTNKLVRFYDGATGLKTGTTDQAGCCLAATAQRDGMELIAVVMGCPTSNDRFVSAKALLNHGFANYEYLTVPLNAETDAIPVTGGTEQSAALALPESVRVFTEKGKHETAIRMDLPEEIRAPVKAGEVLGRAEIVINGKSVARADIRAVGDIDEMTMGRAILRILTGLFQI